MFFDQFASELTAQLIRGLTGQLFTREQIRQITKRSLGRYLEGLFPEEEDKRDRAARLAAAQTHIESASKIMLEMQVELDAQSETLDRLLLEIEEKKSLASKYSALAETNQEAVTAVRLEIEEAIGQELFRQSNQGKTARLFANVFIWLITLVVGAALGAYFKDIIAFVGA